MTISYIGYESVQVKAGRKPLNITMKEDDVAMDEVVVTALISLMRVKLRGWVLR